MAKGPYYNKKSDEPILRESVIVFADILGLKSRIKQVINDSELEQELIKLNNCIREARKNLDDPSKTKWTYRPFSDNIMIGYPRLNNRSDNFAFEFPQACQNIARFQLEMLKDGYFLRGGIGIGNIHIGDDIILGDHLEELVSAEKLANYPRIILLKSALMYFQEIQKNGGNNELNQVIWDDRDAKYINYLYPLGYRNDGDGATLMLLHKGHIESNLNKFRFDVANSNIFEKYLWARAYHNRFCRTSRYYNEKKYIISDSYLYAP
jgi:hypothetical protein